MSQQSIENHIHEARKTSSGSYLPEHHSFHDILLHHSTETSPDEIFMIYYDSDSPKTRITYHEFIRKVRQTAAYYNTLGLQKGDRITVAAHNHPDTIIQYVAAWFLGLSVIPLNMGEDDQRLSFIIRDSSSKLVLCRSEYLQRLSTISDPNQILIQEVDTHSDGLSLYAEIIDSFEPLPFLPKHSMLDHEALIVYTSGTTGIPKAVVLDQQNLLVDADCIAKWHGMSKTSTMMCVLPIHHVNGIVVTHVTPLINGSSIVLNRKFSSEYFFERIEENSVSIVSVVPTLLSYLLQYHKDKPVNIPSCLSHIICGAGPLTCELVHQFEERFTIRVIHGYGLSETTCYSCFLPLNLSQSIHHTMLTSYGFPSIGTPIPCNEMDIHDEQGKSLPELARGEIVIRGTNVMQEYLSNEKANNDAFTHGWFRSGDEGFWMKGLDGLSYFFITGRIKELIIRGGVNLAPFEIDEVLSKAPGVRAGICVGFEHDVYGEEVGALVIADTEDVKPEEILAFCKDQLPFSKAPKCIVFTDELPITSTGKYQRNKVKHLFSDYKSTQFTS
ncbi:MAG: class I adenylate-forming enzyme family protein [Candidatus Kapaibacteriota bacterium]